MSTGENSERAGPYRLVRSLLIEEGRDVLSVAIFALAVGFLSLVVPIGAQTIVNNVGFATFNQPVVFMLGAVFAGLTLAGAIKVIQTIVVERIQVRLFVRSALRLTERIPFVDETELRLRHGEAKLSRWVNRFFEILTVQKTAAGLLLDGISLLLQAVIGLTLLAFYHPILLAFDLVLIAGLGFALFALGRGLVETSIAESYRKHDVAAWLEDLAEKPILFRTPPGFALALSRSDALVESYVLARRAHFRRFVRQVAAFVAIQILASTALLGIGSWLVTKNQLTLGQLVAAELIVSSVLASLLKFEKQLENFYDLSAALDKLRSLDRLPLESRGPASLGATLPGRGPMKLEFRDVRQDVGDKPILRGLSFRLEPGRHAFLTGRKGSGKSTVTKLCYGWTQPSGGTIAVDDEDIRLVPREVLRSHVALLGPLEIITGTLAENLTLGAPGIDRARLRAILAELGVERDILGYKDAFDTVMANDGKPFSHVQTRLIVLARAMLLAPRLLVVDRFFDDFDEEHARRALDAVLRADAPWTALIATGQSGLVRAGFARIHLEEGRAA